MHDWDQVQDLHRTLVEAAPDHIPPQMFGYRGDEPLVTVQLRPFEPGAYQRPIIEALALLLPMGCDRVSLGMAGRVWSLNDPVPPVTDDVDLRQRVLAETRADGHGCDACTVTTLLHPFDVVDGVVTWQPTVDPGPGDGWVADALRLAVDSRAEIGAGSDAETLLTQMARLDLLGHRVAMAPAGSAALLGEQV